MFTRIRVFLFLLSSFLLFCALTADHPPPVASTCEVNAGVVASSGETHVSSFISSYGVNTERIEVSGCALHEGFVPIPHTGRRYLLYLMDRLAPAAGVDPEAYAVDIIREISGPEYINAMTCAQSKVIWVSRKAYQELYGYEPALAYLMAHEIGHGSYRSVNAMKRDFASAAEVRLRNQLTYRQLHEVAVDQRAADIMLRAGYSKEAVLAGARYILWQDGADLILQSGPSHPAGWDRYQLLEYYLNRTGNIGPTVVGRVLPSR